MNLSSGAAAEDLMLDGEGEVGLDPTPPSPAAPDVSRNSRSRGQILRIAVFGIAIILSLTLILFREYLARLAGFGYAGLFVVGLASSATVILPMPGLALVFAAGSSFVPLFVGLAFGTGAALGEMTGYLAGYGGSVIVSEQFYLRRITSLVRKWGAWMVFVLAVLPNPAFDVVGILAGALRIPPWQFLIAAWAGNVIKATLVALAGAGAVNFLVPLIQGWLTK
jgi:membrane protein YqaA with SNARE-associated domain